MIEPSERALLWLRRWQEVKSYYGPRNALRARELQFALRAIHFRNQRELMEDPEFVQFIGRELYSKIRRQVADVMASVVNDISGEPADREVDQYTVKDAVWALKRDLMDKNKGFKVYLRRALLAASSAREWYLTVDWNPNVGPFGEVVFGAERFDKVFLCPPYQDVWDCQLPWLIRERQVSIEAARALFKDTTLLADSQGADDLASGMTIDERGRVTFGAGSDSQSFGQTVTLIYCWSQFDESKMTAKNERTLKPEDRYYWCAQCQHAGEPVGVPDELPQTNGMCPYCAIELQSEVPMQLVERETLTYEQLAYKRGRRLEVIAVRSAKVMNSGNEAWPVPEAGFPFCKIVRYEDPLETSGLSDTKIDGPLQVISDVLMQKAYQQAFTAPNVLFFKGATGPKAADGSPFQITNEPWQTGFVDDPMTSVEHFKAEPVWNALAQFWSSVQQAFRADLGVVELGQAQQNPRGTAGVTIDRLIESGSVPTDDWISQIRDWLEPFFGVVSAYQRRFWTEARWVRMKGATGAQSFKRLSGADIPGADFTLTSDRTKRMLGQQEAQAIIQWAQLPEPLRSKLASRFGVDQEFVDDLRQEEQEQQDRMRAMAGNGYPAGLMAPPGGPGANGVPGNAPGMTAGQFA